MPAEFWLWEACAQRAVGGSRLAHWVGLRRTSYARIRGLGAGPAPVFLAGREKSVLEHFQGWCIRAGAKVQSY